MAGQRVQDVELGGASGGSDRSDDPGDNGEHHDHDQRGDRNGEGPQTFVAQRDDHGIAEKDADHDALGGAEQRGDDRLPAHGGPDLRPERPNGSKKTELAGSFVDREAHVETSPIVFGSTRDRALAFVLSSTFPYPSWRLLALPTSGSAFSFALVTLNRPDLLNAIDGTLLDDLDAALDEIEASGEVRAVIITGAGRAFCAGADLSGTGTAWTKPSRTPLKTSYDGQVRLADQMTRLYELSVPVIAAVNGAAVGGGLAYALHCDVRIASESARFGSAFITAGFSSLDMGTSYLLPKIVGAGRAREMMLSGRIIDATEAYRIGLVQEVVPQPNLLDAALAVARRIAANNEFGVWQTKLGLNVALDAPSLRHAKEIENRTQILAVQTGNPKEAGLARRERRAPDFDRM